MSSSNHPVASLPISVPRANNSHRGSHSVDSTLPSSAYTSAAETSSSSSDEKEPPSPFVGTPIETTDKQPFEYPFPTPSTTDLPKGVMPGSNAGVATIGGHVIANTTLGNYMPRSGFQGRQVGSSPPLGANAKISSGKHHHGYTSGSTSSRSSNESKESQSSKHTASSTSSGFLSVPTAYTSTTSSSKHLQPTKAPPSSKHAINRAAASTLSLNLSQMSLGETPIPPGLIGKNLGALSPVLGLGPGEVVSVESLKRAAANNGKAGKRVGDKEREGRRLSRA